MATGVGIELSEKASVKDSSENGAQLEAAQSEAQPATSRAKNRRKIRQPKQYKPEVVDNDDTTGYLGVDEEASYNDPPVTQRVSHEQQSAASPSSLSSGNPASSPEYTTMMSPATAPTSPAAVHVITASCENNTTKFSRKSNQSGKQKPGPKSSGSKKSAGGKGGAGARIGRRAKHVQPVVPMRPEDLIQESQGDSTLKVTKRDAQYRKSYAYKIWKERGDSAVQSEVDEQKPPGLGAGPPQAVYWPANKYPAGPGFFANGQYYSMNPPQIIHGVDGVPQGSLSRSPGASPPAESRPIPVAGGTTEPHELHAISQEANGRSTPPRVKTQKRKYAGNELGALESAVTPPRIPESTVIPPSSSSTPPALVHSDPSSSPDVARTSPITGSLMRKIKKAAIENSTKGSGWKRFKVDGVKSMPSSSTSPTSLVNVVKSTLRQKHSKENVKPAKSKQKTKRKLEKEDEAPMSGSPTKKGAKSTIFTPLDEDQADKLANDIYDVNLEYFPFETLAEKAAQNDDEDDDDGDDKSIKVPPGHIDKAKEIERVRCLLKDFYDITRSCAEDPDMQKFDSASRKFGRKNILNHLSLLDRYFAELHRRVDSGI